RRSACPQPTFSCPIRRWSRQPPGAQGGDKTPRAESCGYFLKAPPGETVEHHPAVAAVLEGKTRASVPVFVRGTGAMSGLVAGPLGPPVAAERQRDLAGRERAADGQGWPT